VHTEHPSLTNATPAQRKTVADRTGARHLAAAINDPDLSNMAQPRAGLTGPPDALPDTAAELEAGVPTRPLELMLRSRARVVVRAYLQGGDVRNALLVLGQHTADAGHALELVRAAAIELDCDPIDVLYAAARGHA